MSKRFEMVIHLISTAVDGMEERSLCSSRCLMSTNQVFDVFAAEELSNCCSVLCGGSFFTIRIQFCSSLSVIQSVVSMVLRDLQDPSCLVIVLTGRPTHLHDHVLGILHAIGLPIEPSRLMCKTGTQDTLEFKTDVLKMLLKEMPCTTEMSIFEDREPHYEAFCSFAQSTLAADRPSSFGLPPQVVLELIQLYLVRECVLQLPQVYGAVAAATAPARQSVAKESTHTISTANKLLRAQPRSKLEQTTVETEQLTATSIAVKSGVLIATKLSSSSSTTTAAVVAEGLEARKAKRLRQQNTENKDE